MLKVKWIKYADGNWCGLNTVNLATVSGAGVYVIWRGGNPPLAVYVGQGNPISERLGSHRFDKRIQAYANKGLYVTWAVVPAAQRDGVQRYLAGTWNPLVEDALPDAVPVVVNSPWAA